MRSQSTRSLFTSAPQSHSLSYDQLEKTVKARNIIIYNTLACLQTELEKTILFTGSTLCTASRTSWNFSK